MGCKGSQVPSTGSGIEAFACIFNGFPCVAGRLGFGIKMGLAALYRGPDMSIQTLCRCGAALFLAMLAAGCSSTSSGSHRDTLLGNQCKWNPRSCDYSGPYDPGERAYAEKEAARLNEAETARLRHINLSGK